MRMKVAQLFQQKSHKLLLEVSRSPAAVWAENPDLGQGGTKSSGEVEL